MRYTFIIIIFFCSVFCVRAQSNKSVDTVVVATPSSITMDDSARVQMQMHKEQVASQMANASITYFVIHAPPQQFGYTIFIDGQMYIEQKSIPAVAGNVGFSKKEDADQVARLVMAKIKMGEMPPSITVEELKELNIVY